MISVTATVLDGAQEQIYKEISLLISVLTDTQSLSQRFSAHFGAKISSKPKSSEPAFIDTFENPSNLIKVPQCNWQDSIYQLRRTCPPQMGSRNRTERVKTNKAISKCSFKAFAEKILWEGISEHLKNSANEATPHCHTSLSPQRGIQQMGTIAQKLILPWDYTVTSNLLWFVLSIMQHCILHSFSVSFLITNTAAIMRFFPSYFKLYFNSSLLYVRLSPTPHLH